MISDRLGRPGVLEHTTDQWFSPWRFAALLTALIIASFPQVILGLEAFAYGDAGQFAYPVAFYVRESYWRGEIPLWNPLSSCGIPFLAQWNTLALYPLSLVYILLPLPWGFGLFCLLHLFLGGMGMYFLANRWTGHPLAAAVAGVVFAFNGLTWYGVMWPHIIAALAWMPVVLLALEQAWESGRQWLLIAAVAGAMQLLSGGAEVILQTWLVAGVMWVVRLFSKDIPLGKLTLRFLGAACLAAGLSAVQLLPFLDLLAASQRTSGYGSGQMGAIAAMPLTGWVNYVVPLFGCAKNFNGVFMQAGQSWVGSYYLGASVVGLAVLAAWRVRNRRTWMLAGIALFGLLLALGSRGVFYEIASRLTPVLGFIRFPVKFVMLPTFALPSLAAFGVSWLLGLPQQAWPRAKRQAGIIVLVLLAVACVAIAWSWKHPVYAGSAGVVMANAAVRAVFLMLVAVCLVMLQRHTVMRAQRLLQTALIALLWFDVYTHSPNLSPTVPAAALEPNVVRQFFKWEDRPGPGISRAMQSKDSLWKMLSAGNANLEQDTTGRRLAMFQNYNLLDHVPKVDGFYSMDLKHYLEVFKRLYFTTNEAARLKDFLGVSHFSNPTNAVDWIPRDSVLPMVTAGQQPTFVPAQDALSAVLSDAFEPLRVVCLPPEARGAVQTLGESKAVIASLRSSPTRLQFEVQAEAPAMVVVAQSYHRGWRAYVDGQSTPLWRANYAFQALEVPPGKHQVKLIYEDKAFHFGVAVSALSFLACVLIWWSSRGSERSISQPVLRGRRPALGGAVS